jgi:hypothetical protein
MLPLVAGLLLVAGGALKLALLVLEAFFVAIDADPRLPRWWLRPALAWLVALAAGVLLLML